MNIEPVKLHHTQCSVWSNLLHFDLQALPHWKTADSCGLRVREMVWDLLLTSWRPCSLPVSGRDFLNSCSGRYCSTVCGTWHVCYLVMMTSICSFLYSVQFWGKKGFSVVSWVVSWDKRLFLYVSVWISYVLIVNEFTPHIWNIFINMYVANLVLTPITHYFEHFKKWRGTFTWIVPYFYPWLYARVACIWNSKRES